MPGPILMIHQLLPATGWFGLFAKRLDTGEVALWREPLVAWALVDEHYVEEGQDERVAQSVVGMVVWGTEGPTFCLGIDSFVHIYVQDGDDLEQHRSEAEDLINAWEKDEVDGPNLHLGKPGPRPRIVH